MPKVIPEPMPELKTASQVREYLVATLEKAANGKVPVQTAQAIAALAKAAMAAIEAEAKAEEKARRRTTMGEAL